MSIKITEDLMERYLVLREEGYSRRSACAVLDVAESTMRYREKKAEGEDTNKEDVVDIQQEADPALDELCESNDVHVASLAKRLRTAQKTNTQLRKTINGSVDQTSHFEDMVKAVEIASSKVALKDSTTSIYKKPCKAVPATAEILFSDLQIGKVGQYFSTDLAKRSVRKYGQLVIEELSDTNYSFERIIFASIGDIVEDHMKHGVQSATSTDTGLAEQMADAIELMWRHIIQPLGALQIPMDVICVAGNHGSSAHKGMDMYKAGLFSYDYAIYKALEGYCKVAGWEHVKFVIPEGVFAYTDIYGRTAVYEHGYFNTSTEKSLCEQKSKRSQQIKRHVEYFRCGDMHHVCDYNNGQEVVNGAFFGVDFEGVEYSGILGFNSIPAQKMMVHTREDSIGRNTIKRNINIQVADGY